MNPPAAVSIGLLQNGTQLAHLRLAARQMQRRRVVMAGIASIRVVTVLLLATCPALCQQPKADSLPDAPMSKLAPDAESLRAAFDATHLSVVQAATKGGISFRPGGFEPLPIPREPADLAIKRLFAAPQRHGNNTVASDHIMRRATDAALSLIVTHDDAGRRTLNTSYLLRVLTSAAADSARTPYWRRSLSQPASDFGSTIGDDAGMRVFDQIKPGIMQLVKTHEPGFISAIAKHFGKQH
jgi:hypothetical protein